MADRELVFQVLLGQAVRLNMQSTVASVCLSFGLAVAKTNPALAVRFRHQARCLAGVTRR